jgi:hypothetical protein
MTFKPNWIWRASVVVAAQAGGGVRTTIGIEDIGIGCIPCRYWTVEICSIQDVENLRPELQVTRSFILVSLYIARSPVRRWSSR